jgi:stearoyl-CoA desaturase (delta-9 desaturase)
LAWYEFDPSWLQIKVLKRLGLAKAIHVASVKSVFVEREAA